MKEKIKGLDTLQEKNATEQRNGNQTTINILRDKKQYLKLYLPKRQILFLQNISKGNISRKASDILEAYITKYQEEAHHCLDCSFSTAQNSTICCMKHEKPVDIHETCAEFAEYQL